MELLSPPVRSPRRLVALRGLLTAVLLGILAASALPTIAQDVPPTKAAADAAADPAGKNGAEQAGTDAAEKAGMSWEDMAMVLTIVALFVVPILIGGALAKKLRMPDHGWKFSLALGTMAAAGLIVAMGEVKLGPDLSGGITLIYELQETSQADADAAAAELPDGQAAPGGAFEGQTRDETIAALIKALTERVDPSGIREVSIKKFGDGQIEIIIPKADNQQDLEFIERKIYTAGSLAFRITASPKFPRHKEFIDLANGLPPGQNSVLAGGHEVARWVEYDTGQFGDRDEAEQNYGLVTRMSGATPQALIMTDDGLDVTGGHLRRSSPDVDQMGNPAVSFVFNADGARRFGQLTGNHLPNPSGARYQLGILLDNRLLSAPSLKSRISDQGIIEGIDSNEEVEFLVGVLNAGSLPAALNKTPISRAQISPTLGELTVEQGKQALIISLAFVAVFMVFYYRFAGLVACLGLAINMLLIVASMVLIKAAFTLPGLAGLVLTVGMSVDANVLIYERIRDELKRGAALRMAIRNGFNRASITIIDSNVTNLITAAVIYKIAPDSVKGFGVTLFLGILISVFTAVFLTRIVFDVAERLHWIKSLRFRQFIGDTNFDFLSWRRACIAGSLLVIAVGLAAVIARGRDMLDIDFTGGSSVTIVLQDDQAMTFAEVMDELKKTPLAEENLTLVAVGEKLTGTSEKKTRYTVTTINDDVTEVEDILAKAFRGKLQAYRVDVTDISSNAGDKTPVSSTNRFPRRSGSWPPLPTPLSYVALLQDAQPENAAADDPAEPASDPPTAEEPADDAPAAETPDQPASDAPEAADDDQSETEAPPATESAPSSEAAQAAATPPASASSTSDPFAGGTTAKITFTGDATKESAGISHGTLEQLLVDALTAAGHPDAAYRLSNPEYQSGSIRGFKDWEVNLALPLDQAQGVLNTLQETTNSQPVFPLSNKIGGRVAARMAADAVVAIVLCLAGVIGYVWFRFHGVIYGIAAVVALIHDVLVTLGFVALSSYFVDFAEPVASGLMIDKFQINLTLVAAFLTIIGYSLNDTIVIFDRVREIKGKSPRLTPGIVNASVNQTLARTILTALTTLVSTIILFIFGGDGIHAFAFALLVGFIAGVYSTIFIASPVLMWLSDRFEGAAARSTAKAA